LKTTRNPKVPKRLKQKSKLNNEFEKT
jgi:hypothetical protein